VKQLELKIPPVGVFLLFAAAMWLLARLTPPHAFDVTFRLGLITALLAASAVFGLGGVAHFRRAGTTVHPLRPEQSSALVTGGVYRLSRNPMYLSLLLALLALGLGLSNLFALAFAALFVPCMNRFQIVPEERAMERLFGDEFAAYRARVRRWI
jgi:protein-S-isoprenylcysteine O-methyltransferase Ste14